VRPRRCRRRVTFKHGGEDNGEALTVTYARTFESATALRGDVNVLPFDVSGMFKAEKKK
jgi:hypothetical protein